VHGRHFFSFVTTWGGSKKIFFSAESHSWVLDHCSDRLAFNLEDTISTLHYIISPIETPKLGPHKKYSWTGACAVNFLEAW
jgi:hypothetical protein